MVKNLGFMVLGFLGFGGLGFGVNKKGISQTTALLLEPN